MKKFLIWQNWLVKTALSIVVISGLVFSCTNDPQPLAVSKDFSKSTVESLKTKYGLVDLDKASLPKDMVPIKVASYEEAVRLLEKAKSLKNEIQLQEDKVLTYNASSLSDGIPNARRLFVCENSWLYADLGGAGMFSSWDATWYQSSTHGATNVDVQPRGFQVGWGWQQQNVYKFGTRSFCVQGTVTFGIDLGGVVVGSSDRYRIKVDLTRECTVSVSEGYGFCGM